MISLMLSYLFYFKGMQQLKARKRRLGKTNSLMSGVYSVNNSKSKNGLMLESQEIIENGHHDTGKTNLSTSHFHAYESGEIKTRRYDNESCEEEDLNNYDNI